MITAVIIDDESRAREAIRTMLNGFCPNINVVGEADGVETGFKQIQQLNPEAVFLDIQMPDGSGFDLLKRFPSIDFKFVIITAYQEFAVKAFKFSAIDYLLKPIDPSDLINAVDKLKETLLDEEINQRFKTFIENTQVSEGSPNKIILKTFDSVMVAETGKILRCESQNNYTLFFFTDGSKVLVSRTLKEYEELLSSSGFLRIHQSHLVNLKFIKGYKRFPESQITLSDETKLPVAIRKRELVESILGSNKK